MKEEQVLELRQLANSIRKDIIRIGYLAEKKGAHFGGSLSIAEVLATLYSFFVTYNLEDLENRDRLILSKGHAALALYCALFERGLLSKEMLENFEQNGSDIVAHSKKDLQKGIEFSGGSLGLGLSYAVGVAYACRKKEIKNRIYVIVGDGELNEGITWEALMFAAHYHLNNLTVIVDHNHLQADGFIEDVMNTSPLEEKFISFGYNVDIVDGHSVQDLYTALSKQTENFPRAIIAETVKGKGVSFIENKVKWHHGSLNEQRYLKALKELGEEVGDDR